MIRFTVFFSLLITAGIVFVLALLSVSDTERKNNEKISHLIHGIGFEAPPHPTDSTIFKEMKTTHANWVALMPFAYVPPSSGHVIFNQARQWWGERPEGIIACAQMAKKQNFQIMLKPQLWIGNGQFTGSYSLTTDSLWQELEKEYANYILFYAQLADSLQIELFCIGTELEIFVKSRPQFWIKLIQDIRRIYKGKLTYAENWDAYFQVPFWQQLDYIGVDAYFPLCKTKTPSVNELINNWKETAAELSNYSQKLNRSILFTEYGYRSMDACAAQPWDSDSNGSINMEAQQNAYEALFQTFHHAKWFAGGFLWKWHNHGAAGGMQNNDYTPQNKPVLQTLIKWYAK
jgi:hypothetical protein